MPVRKPGREHGVGRWAIWWPLALIAVLPGLTWLAVSDESWKRSEKIAAVGVAASIAAAVAIYIGSRLDERRAATRPPRVTSTGDDGGLGDGLAVATQKNRICFNLPTVAASFTGRDQELDEVTTALAVADRAVITQAISGLGGVGKSQLAARYVQQHSDDYDIVAWIRAEDGGVADLAQLAAKLGLPVEELSPSDRAEHAREWLSECEQRWLMVLDNIESPEQLEALVPRSGSGRVLVTSRDRSLRQFGPMLTLDVFDENSATAYLTERAGRPDDECAAREVARALGCLPLALSHAAAYCQSGTSFTDYYDLLDKLPARDLFDSNPELSYTQTVSSTWKASIQAASAAAALASDVLAMAAYLGPDAIPKFVFGALVDVDTARGRKCLADALNALARFSLATVDDHTVSVHRLLQKVVRDDGAERDDGQTAARRALTAMDDVFPTDPEPPTCWRLCEQLLPHALALAETLPQPNQTGSRLIELLSRTCWYLNCAEPGRRGVAVAQRALADAERLLGSEHPGTLSIRHNLAIAYRAAGRLADAIAISEPLLADRQRILGAEHHQTLFARNTYANACRVAGRFVDAIAIAERLVADSERILGAEHPDTLRARNTLANTYRDARRVEEAIALFESLLTDVQRIFGPVHTHTLSALHNLARAYREAERVEEAIPLLEQVLADRRRILGPEHLHTLHVRNDLANAYRGAGRSADAITISEPLLSDTSRIFGAEHPFTLWVGHNLAMAYQDSGRIEEAIALFEPLLTKVQRIFGPDNPHALQTRKDLASTYHAASVLRRAPGDRIDAPR